MELKDLPDIAQAVKDDVKKHIKIYPVRANYASECGHECERYLYYQRTHWDQKTPHDATLEFIFSGGRMIEALALKELTGAGYRVVEQQRPFTWDALELTGRVDCQIRLDGHLVPIEIKGYAHQEFVKLNTLTDFIGSSKPWIRRAAAQLLVYMWMVPARFGGIYLKSKTTYEPKIIWVCIDDYVEYAEAILQKLERVNECVNTGILPDRIEYDEKLCLDCSYFHICKPDVQLAEGTQLLNDPELLEALKERDALIVNKKRYEEVDDYVKTKLKGVERAVIGEFIVTGRSITGSRKPSPGGPFEYWRTDIRRFVNKD